MAILQIGCMGWDRIMALKNDMDVQILTTNEQTGMVWLLERLL